MFLLLLVLVIVFVRIHDKDVKQRLIYHGDLIALILIRVVVCCLVHIAYELGHVESVFGLIYMQWNIRALIRSIVLAVVVCFFVEAVAFITHRLTNKYDQQEDVLGVGDVKLYGVCCLFVAPEYGFAFMLLSAFGGTGLALYAKFAQYQDTFAFAPAIIWACFITVVLEGINI